MLFVAESVALCGLKNTVISLVFKFFSQLQASTFCLLSLRILSLRTVSFGADCFVMVQASDMDYFMSKNSKGGSKDGVGLKGKDPFQMLQETCILC